MFTGTGYSDLYIPLCIFFNTRVFYHCPTSSLTPVSKKLCRPGRNLFQNQNQDRPCVDPNAVRATHDCVHRVTVLCAVPCALSHISDHDGVFGLCCATLFYSVLLCHTHPLLCPLCCALCCVCLSVSGRRRRLVKVLHGRFLARSGAPYQSLPTVETKPKTMWSCMWNPLPILTGSCARGAKPIGAFGLVPVPLPFPTNQPIWLCPTLPAPLPTLTTATDQTKRPLRVGQYRSGCG